MVADPLNCKIIKLKIHSVKRKCTVNTKRSNSLYQVTHSCEINIRINILTRKISKEHCCEFVSSRRTFAFPFYSDFLSLCIFNQ